MWTILGDQIRPFVAGGNFRPERRVWFMDFVCVRVCMCVVCVSCMCVQEQEQERKLMETLKNLYENILMSKGWRVYNQRYSNKI